MREKIASRYFNHYRLKAICKQKGIPILSILKESGYSTDAGYYKAVKNDTIPLSFLVEISKKLGKPVDYFIQTENFTEQNKDELLLQEPEAEYKRAPAELVAMQKRIIELQDRVIELQDQLRAKGK